VAPLQDTPAIKATYVANVTVKDPYVVKMSGMELPKTVQKGNFSTYHFY
jgi:aminopeptidase N